MKKPTTPFTTSGYYGPRYFCDREEETDLLVSNITNGQSTTLTSIRRMGKTGLIMHVGQKLPAKKWKLIYLDILSTETRGDLLNRLATAVLNAIPEKDSFGEKVWNLIKSLRPTLSFDSLTGIPQVSFNVQHAVAQENIAVIFSLLDEYPEYIVIAIDEFQQILNYPEENTDAWLRSIIQHLKNVVFIYAGSQQHLMQELFAQPSRPFYRSTQFMKLGRIAEDSYIEFIQYHFKRYKRTISTKVAGEILNWTRRHTYYVQLLLNRTFIRPEKKITSKCWQEEAQKLLQEQQTLFFNYRELLTNAQWNLMKAIASEGRVTAPTAQDFLKKYDLDSSATVLRSLNSLIKKELIFSDFTKTGKKFYGVYDLLFERWMQKSQVS